MKNRKILHYFKNYNQKGSTLFFAIIVTTLILTLGLSIAQIIVTELKMGGDFSNSQVAYYVAEKGLESAKLKIKEDPNFTGQVCYGSPFEYCYDIQDNAGEKTITAKGLKFNIFRSININYAPPIQVPVTAVYAGGSTSAALKNDSTLWFWGNNYRGQFGNGTIISSYTPVQSPFSNVETAFIGQISTLVLKKDNTLWGCGSGRFGNGFNNWPDPITYPVQILTDVKTVSTGYNHTLAIKNDGTLWAWGDNSDGQLGDNTTNPSDSPKKIGTATNWKAVSAGMLFSIALKEDGTVWTWGQNALGQLGNGTTGADVLVPTQIALNGASGVAAGRYSSFAIKNGEVWAWGWNLYGVIDNACSVAGTCSTPAKVSTVSNIVSIYSGYNFAIALKSDGEVWGWGENGQGELGDGAYNFDANPDPRKSLITGNVIDIKTGPNANHVVALKDNGEVWAWGYDWSGQIGDGVGNSTTDIPVQVPGLD